LDTVTGGVDEKLGGTDTGSVASSAPGTEPERLCKSLFGESG